MAQLGSYRAGAGLISEQFPSMERSMVSGSLVYDNGAEWFQHFTKCVESSHRADLPRPKMFKNIPCLIGDFAPNGVEDYQKRILANLNGDYAVFPEEKYQELRDPTQKEYDKHFRKSFENNIYTIRASKGRKSYKGARRTLRIKNGD